MKKYRKILFAVIMALSMVGASITSFAWTTDETVYTIPEQQYQTLQVGDELRVNTSIWDEATEVKFGNVKMEILEGSGSVEIKENRGYNGDYAVFTAPGTVKLKVQKERNGKAEDEIMNLKVLPREAVKVTYPTGSSKKLGDPLQETESLPILVQYENCLYNADLPQVELVGYDGDARGALYQYFLMCDFGSYKGVYEDRTSTRVIPAIAAYRPGILKFRSTLYGKEIGDTHTITIEEPVIHTNLPKIITAGSSIEVETSLDNTNIPDKKIAEIGDFEEDFSNTNGYTIGYRPKVEVLEGAELITRSEGDYSNTMHTSEKIIFNEGGKVTFKITYEMINPWEKWGNTDFDGYNPETTVTVEVKEEVLDYTDKTNPTSEELQQAVEHTVDGGRLTIRVKEDLSVDSQVLTAIKNGNHKVVVERMDETGKLQYSWMVAALSDVSKEWNTKVEIGKETSALSKTLQGFKGAGKSVTVLFDHEGKLPGTAEVKLYVGDKFKTGQKLYYYYFDESVKKFEKVGDSFEVDAEGYVTVMMEHCSDYVFTENELVLDSASPKTGDTLRVFPFVAELFVALGCIMVVRKRAKR